MENKVELKDKLAWTIPEAAMVSGIGENKLRALTQAEEIPYFFSGTKKRIPAQALREYVEKIGNERKVI